MTYKQKTDAAKKAIITTALEEADGNVSLAARRLEMPIRTMWHLIKVLGIKRDEQLCKS
jgi:transcriptional regulator with GAF, ATPase, and Fis domain